MDIPDTISSLDESEISIVLLGHIGGLQLLHKMVANFFSRARCDCVVPALLVCIELMVEKRISSRRLFSGETRRREEAHREGNDEETDR